MHGNNYFMDITIYGTMTAWIQLSIELLHNSKPIPEKNCRLK